VTIYVAANGLEQLAHAQTVIDSHLVECLACSRDRPCRERREAEDVFTRHGRLPQRRPGITGGAALTRARFDGFKNVPNNSRAMRNILEDDQTGYWK